MKRKISVAFFILALLVLIGAYSIQEPNQQLRNLNREEIFDFAVKSFEKEEKFQSGFSLSEFPQFLIDRSLVDPAFMLPHYYLYPFEAISEFVKAESSCQNTEKSIFKSLPDKFSIWLRYKCKMIKSIPTSFFSVYPFIHPSGFSFANLLKEMHPNPSFTHVLENQQISTDLLWALMKGIRVITDHERIWIRQGALDEHDSAKGKYLVYFKKEFQQFVSTLGIEMKTGLEENSESFPGFYLERIQAQNKYYILKQRLITGSLLVLFSLLLFGFVELLRIRLSEHRKRTFSFQLLAHELRTPVAALKIEVEELLRRYDDLPSWAQSKAMRFADNLDRLGNVIKASDNYIRSRKNLSYLDLPTTDIESVNEMIEKVAETFSEGVKIQLHDNDCGMSLDLYWVSFCISNLISNGLQHGQVPVLVGWKKNGASVEITVSDQGTALRDDPRHSRSAASTQGLRIGLEMVDRITRELGGKLVFKENPTTWTLSFTKVTG